MNGKIERRPAGRRSGWGILACAVLAVLILTVYASNDLYNSFRVSNAYYIPSVFNELGFPYCFCHQFTTYPVDRPEGFSRSEAEGWDAGGETGLGADVNVEGGSGSAKARDGKLHGTKIYLDKVSVGATMNIILAASMARGRTIIENAAKEPHIVDLANFLNSMGADVRGAGTDSVKVNGTDALHGGSYTIIPDQIEAGTYMVACAAAGGEVRVKNVIPRHLESISAKLREMGVGVTAYEDSVVVKSSGRLRRVNIKTMPYPGFPTDMQPQFAAALCLANGRSVITEGIYDNRFKYMTELRKMGAQVDVDGRTAAIDGVDGLSGAPVAACDLRAGAAMVIAGLSASGTTEVEDIHYIERGYEDFVGKLRGIGADISLVDMPDEPERAAAPQLVC